MAISAEKYVSFTTFTKSGDARSTPVWIVDLGDGTLGFTTASSSWKVKRLRNNPKVLLQPSDSRGTPTAGSQPSEGSATLVDGVEFERVRDLVRKKYGLQFFFITIVGSAARLIGKGSGTDTGVVIALD